MHFISAGFYHNIFSRCKELSDWRKPHTKRNFRRQTAQLEIYSRGLLVYFVKYMSGSGLFNLKFKLFMYYSLYDGIVECLQMSRIGYLDFPFFRLSSLAAIYYYGMKDYM